MSVVFSHFVLLCLDVGNTGGGGLLPRACQAPPAKMAVLTSVLTPRAALAVAFLSCIQCSAAAGTVVSELTEARFSQTK